MAKVEGMKNIKQTLKNLQTRIEYLARQETETISKDIEENARKNFNRFAREVSADDRFVSVSRTKQSDNEATIICQGTQVLFIEFGVGVLNATQLRKADIPQPRPVPIVPLGTYGKGHGKDDYWVRPAQFINKTAGESAVHDRFGNVRQGVAWTRGHKPARALWNARNHALKEYDKRKERVANDKYFK